LLFWVIHALRDKSWKLWKDVESFKIAKFSFEIIWNCYVQVFSKF
jgi:hypothetical protein